MAIKISEMQKSALLEAGNIGSGHAAIALSQLMGRKIMIAIPSVEVFDLPGLNGKLDGKETKTVQISLSVLGSARGVVIFTIKEEMAFMLCDIVMGQPQNQTKMLSNLELSALKEVGSIIGASYLNAISELTGLSLIVSTPEYYLGKLSLIDKILTKKEIDIKEVKDVLCIKTEFIESAAKIEGYLFFVPVGESVERIMNALGV